MNARQLSLIPENNPDKGYRCECCGQFVKRYRRKLNSNMAMVLLRLYKSGNKNYLHVEKFITEQGLPRSGDFHKLIHWKLLDKLVEYRKDGSSRNGYYRLNGRGMMFCERKSSVQETAVIFNGKLEKFEGREITIDVALGNKFDYNELMYK